MPRVRYTAAGGHYRVGGHGFDPGDEAEVSADLAAYLEDVEEFAVLDDAGEDARADETADQDDEQLPAEDAVEAGVCPWCDDYEGDAVAQHASAAHPDEWADYSEG